MLEEHDSTTEGGGSERAGSSSARAAAGIAPVAMAGLHGVVSAFDGNQEEWVEYAERLENYFIANDLNDPAKRRAILLNGVGPSTYRLIKTLCLPESPKDFSFSDLVARVTAHFNPKPSIIIKRFEFNTRKQKSDETVAEYIAALRKIAEYCDYGGMLNDMLRDRLVCGIMDKRVQRRFLQAADLTYTQARDMALAAETADKDSKRLQSHANDPFARVDVEDKAVHQVTKPSKPPVRRGPPVPSGHQDTGCYRCGGKHQASRCKFKDYECHFCKKKGHLAAVCRKKKQAKSEPRREQAHRVDALSSGDESDQEYTMYRISSGSSKPLIAHVRLNGIDTPMEVDTGASVSLMCEEAFKPLQESGVALHETKAKLLTYTGESIEVIGATDVRVEHNGQEATLPLIVTRDKGPSLLGRNWLAALQLDWQQILTVKTTPTLQDVLDQYSDVFEDKLGTVKGVTAKIYTDPTATPQFHKARSVPFALREKVEVELERLQQEGIIEPVQFSDWAAPIVPVMKSDGSVRICGDYKVTINRAAKLDKYPIPRIDELFASLSGGKRFSKLDLSHAYQQIQLDEESCQYATINTHKGLFKYNRLPFGVASAPSIFQRVMENLLQGIPGVCVYIDDILVTGGTDEEHVEHLAEVLRRLSKAGMKLKRAKCAFLLPSVEYLGHTISADGLHTSEDKVSGIVKAPAPKDVTELRSFLGLVNYYGKFLPDLATTLSPLYSLLQKQKKWVWGRSQAKAFDDVKGLLQSSRVLVHFNDKLPLTLACDASPYGVGAVLSHKMDDGGERPVAFASRTLTTAEKKYSQLDKEALAIIFGVKKYHQYLLGRQFELKTDHKPLTHIFSESRATPTMASGRIQRWALTLSAYSYTITYKKGEENANADALSRLPLPVSRKDPPKPPEVIHLMEYLDTSPVSSGQIRAWTDCDPVLAKVKGRILTGWPAEGDPVSEEDEMRPYTRRRYELSVEDGCVLWGNRIVVPKKGRSQVLRMLHEAHPGIVRMKGFARGYVWWPGIDQELERCVKSCETCQVNRKSPPVSPLYPWSWPSKPWARVHVDYAGPFCGKMFLLMIDAQSKWLEVHMTSSSTSETTISCMRKSFASLGLPEVVVSDNAANFTSEEFQQFLAKNGVKHVRTPPYHPASNGLAERAVQTFKEGMRKLKDGSLETKLARFLFKYRITPQSSTGISPAELMYGRRLRSHLDNLRPDLDKKVRQSQERQKRGHDSHAKFREFKVGDSVYAKNYGSQVVWLPGKVTEIHGSALYTILLNDGRSVRKHTDQLRMRFDNKDTLETSSDDSNDDIEGPLVSSKSDPTVATPEPTSESPHAPTHPENSETDVGGPTEGAERDSVPSPPEPRRSGRSRQPPDRYGY